MIKKTSKYKTPEEWIGTNSITRLSVNLPDDWHARFKAITARKRIKMTSVAIKLIRTYVETNEKALAARASQNE